MNLTNVYEVAEIEMTKCVHCFCPLGEDWYTAQATITVKPDAIIFDYCDVDEFIKSNIEGKTLIIEEVAQKLVDMCKIIEPRSVEVEVHVEDAVHLPVTVKTIWWK